MNQTLSRTFESLTVRNYRLFFSGQVISWTGTWVQWVAQGWLVLQLTHSGFGLGLVTALQWFPVLIFGAWMGGVVFDWAGNYDFAWGALITIGLGAFTLQLLMDERPPHAGLRPQLSPT